MNSLKPVRVRFAPSPSGHIHLGNARVALLNYVFAVKSAGEFVLRIDDTDTKSSDPDNIPQIINDLKRLQVTISGTPVHQSSRLQRYRQIAQQLKDSGWAYPCYCSPEKIELENRLALKANKPPRYSGRCKNLHGAELEKVIQSATEPPVLRFNVDPHGQPTVKYVDLILGEVETPLEGFGDFIIMRSNGIASYNFASVIDDMDMGITHIVRGADHLSNTARQLLIWEALKYPAPQLAHLSLLSGPNGEPLSKRQGDSSVHQILQSGQLPQALAHYLVSIGNTHLPQEPFASIDKLAEHFTWPSSASVTRHEPAKLDFFNRLYLHALPTATTYQHFCELQLSVATAPEKVMAYIDVFKGNFSSLRDIQKVDLLWPRHDDAHYNFNRQTGKVAEHLQPAELDQLLRTFEGLIGKMADDSEPTWQQLVQNLVASMNLPKKKLFMSLRLLLTNDTHGPELHRIMQLIGKTELLNRLKKA